MGRRPGCRRGRGVWAPPVGEGGLGAAVLEPERLRAARSVECGHGFDRVGENGLNGISLQFWGRKTESVSVFYVAAGTICEYGTRSEPSREYNQHGLEWNKWQRSRPMTWPLTALCRKRALAIPKKNFQTAPLNKRKQTWKVLASPNLESHSAINGQDCSVYRIVL
jgi:hypothetical protein